MQGREDDQEDQQFYCLNGLVVLEGLDELEQLLGLLEDPGLLLLELVWDSLVEQNPFLQAIEEGPPKKALDKIGKNVLGVFLGSLVCRVHEDLSVVKLEQKRVDRVWTVNQGLDNDSLGELVESFLVLFLLIEQLGKGLMPEDISFTWLLEFVAAFFFLDFYQLPIGSNEVLLCLGELALVKEA